MASEEMKTLTMDDKTFEIVDAAARAELKDLRKCYDGKIFETAGKSVRIQIQNLHDENVEQGKQITNIERNSNGFVGIKSIPVYSGGAESSLFDYLNSYDGKTLSGANFLASDMRTYQNVVTDLSTGHVYEPVRVRRPDGTLIQTLHCEVETARYGTAPVAFAYDADGNPLYGMTKDAVSNGVLNIEAEVYFIVPVRYDNLAITLTAKLGAMYGVEVADIRVGYNGTKYETAGEAVRQQVSDIHTANQKQAEEFQTQISDVREDSNCFVGIKSLPVVGSGVRASLFSYLNSYDGRTLSNDDFMASDMWTYLHKTTTYDGAHVYEPIRVRDVNGRLIQGIYCELDYSKYGTAPVVFCYDSKGKPLYGLTRDAIVADELDIPDEVYFIVPMRFDSVQITLEANLEISASINEIKALPNEHGTVESSLFSYLREYNRKTLSNANFLASDMFTYQNVLTDYATAHVYEPIRVRRPDGTLIQELQCVLETARYGTAPVVFCYGADGQPLYALTAAAVKDGILEIPETAYFIVPMRYDNLIISITAKLGVVYGVEHYTVGTGMQFATLTQCLRALRGDCREKVIDVFGGTYDIYQEMGGAAFVATLTGNEKWYDVCDIIPDNTTIMGHGNVIIKMELPSSTPNAVATLLSPLNMMGSAKLKNLTIIASNCRYCVHPEGDKFVQYNNAVWEIEDCYIEKTDVTLGTGNAIACGLNDGVFFKIKNCIITSVGDSCFSMHDNSPNYAQSPCVVFENCALDAKYYPIVFSCTYRDNMQAVIKVLVANCHAPKYMRKRTSNTYAKDCYKVTYINTPHKTQHGENITDLIPDIYYSNFA